VVAWASTGVAAGVLAGVAGKTACEDSRLMGKPVGATDGDEGVTSSSQVNIDFPMLGL
jgi:hypothetical protein